MLWNKIKTINTKKSVISFMNYSSESENVHLSEKFTSTFEASSEMYRNHELTYAGADLTFGLTFL